MFHTLVAFAALTVVLVEVASFDTKVVTAIKCPRGGCNPCAFVNCPPCHKCQLYQGKAVCVQKICCRPCYVCDEEQNKLPICVPKRCGVCRHCEGINGVSVCVWDGPVARNPEAQARFNATANDNDWDDGDSNVTKASAARPICPIG